MSSMGVVPAVGLYGITKRFGEVTACDSVDVELHRGRIHGLLGENGAGKSTLMKILIGLQQPDDGRIEIDGKETKLPDPLAAQSAGVAMVHQHFSLIGALTVWENVVLGERRRLDRQAARDLVGDVGDHYGLHVDPDARVGGLSAGLRQRVEIIKCLRRDPQIVIFDEPTSVLTPQESEQLFSVLRVAVERDGKAVALVSHKLDEILHATDDVTVLRRGRVADRFLSSEADPPSLARAMVGRDVSLRGEAAALGLTEMIDGSASRVPEREAVLSVRGLHLTDPGLGPVLDGVDFDVRAGEIVGLAGVEGNGQLPLVDVLSSLRRVDSGTVSIHGENVPIGQAGAMSTHGISVIPEDRHDSGCVLDMTVAENLALGSPSSGGRFGVIDRGQQERLAERAIEQFGIVCAGPAAPFSALSGGNQQRVVLARELSAAPKVLVAAQPTRGLDVGAIEFVSEKLRETADGGAAVLLVSSELDELLHLADRLLVIHRGRIVGEMLRAEADAETLGLLMGGVVDA
jgi:simple sugar transport system ATP-binding protein